METEKKQEKIGRYIELKKRDEKSVEPEELKARLYPLFGIEYIEYSEHPESKTGTLFLKAQNRNYDIQQVGHVISGSGYNILLPTEKRTEKSVLEKVVSFYDGAKEGLRQGMKNLVNTGRRAWQDRQDISDLIKRKQKQKGEKIK